MKIGTRIMGGYLAAVVVFTIVGAVAYKANEELVESNNAVTRSYQVRNTLSQILIAMVNAETGQRGYLLTGDSKFLDPYDTGQRDARMYLQQLKTQVSDSPFQTERANSLQAAAIQRLGFLNSLIENRRTQGVRTLDTAALENGRQQMDQVRKIIAEIDGDETRLLDQRLQSARDGAKFAAATIIVGSMAAVAFTILLSVIVQRSITVPLQSFMVMAEKIGEGDLTQRLDLTNKDELGQLSASLDRMARGLREVATRSAAVSEDLNAATSEILASTQQQAASTAEQAAAVQQANVTMSQLSQSGAQISDRAKQVAAAAEAVSTVNVSGLESVRNTKATMEGIREQAESVAQNVIALSEKTQAVGEIITSVNEISEQSHLLALNASIQAAAAGEHGRSFTVVANEMKSLASQSKQATVQVRAILGDIQRGINTSVMLTEEAVKRADAGKQQANVADRTIRKLSDNLEESIRAFQQIVAGSAQQQIGFEQVTQAFRSISIAAQETAASTKQSEKAAANLNTLSQQLRDTVRRYKV